MSIHKWSKKVCQKLLKIFKVHYLDRNFFFLRLNYADCCRSRGRGRTGEGGVLLPAAALCDEPGKKPQTWLFHSSLWTHVMFALPKRESREGKRTLVFLRENTVYHFPHTVGRGGQSFPGLQNTCPITEYG